MHKVLTKSRISRNVSSSCLLSNAVKLILLTNRVRGPYCKLQTAFFCGEQEGHDLKWKKQSAVTYITDEENSVSKICSLLYLLEIESSWNAARSQAVRTLEF